MGNIDTIFFFVFTFSLLVSLRLVIKTLLLLLEKTPKKLILNKSELFFYGIMMSYTYKKVEGQDKQYQVTADNNGTEVVFNVGVALDESEIAGLVQHHLDYLNADKTPVINYVVQRQSEYPPIAEQLDTLYHGGYDAWKAEIQAIKDKYPKA